MPMPLSPESHGGMKLNATSSPQSLTVPNNAKAIRRTFSRVVSLRLRKTVDSVMDNEFDQFDAFDYSEDQLQALDALETDYFAQRNVAHATQMDDDDPCQDTTASSASVQLEDLLSMDETTCLHLEPNEYIMQTPPISTMPLASADGETLTSGRARGRPKGSRNKKTLARMASQMSDETVPEKKRPRGRPPGKSRKQLTAPGGSENGRHGRGRVGCPKKPFPTFGACKSSVFSINEGLRVPGFPANRRTTMADASPVPDTQSGSPNWMSHVPIADTDAADAARPSAPTSTGLPDAEHALAPEADPSQIIEDLGNDDSEDDEAQLLEDGIGGDDEEGDDDDDIEEQGAADNGGDHAPPRFQPPRPLPAWLKERFDACVKQSRHCGPDKVPSLYWDHKTFWFPRPSNYFLLQDLLVSPQRLYDCDIFLWDPMALLPDGISCPNPGCTERLWHHTHISRPRHVIDINKSFWILGYRYRCPRCVKPNSVTFRSWDPRVLAALPRNLSAQFPARLTFRSGMALDALAFMRSCFQHGMGAKQFSNALRVQHLQNYDRIHLQYLHTLATRQQSPFRQPDSTKFKAFLAFDDRSSDG
ncbi:hypothetical protein FPV67DRAFT_1455911 [Lyophyllum atratum]|nr:hypothetical protein FPV67DRAFT_1455911 [Lyophyllum atratum]